MTQGLASTIMRLKRILAIGAMLVLAGPTPAQPSETAVKAAFLSKFAAYVSWPVSVRRREGEAITLCLVGGDPFGRTIDDAVRGQQVDSHPVQVKRLARPADGCDLAFLAGSASLEGMKGKPVLTVTDARSSVQRGMVHFVVAQGRVRFHIDEAAAARSGLTINSRLLALALTVRQRD